VLGAINVDLVVSGGPLPSAGETVTGGTFSQHHGGKGGNQAVAAARALRPEGDMLSRSERAAVAIVAAVGDDSLGAAALEALRGEGIQTDHALVTAEAPTGVALIAVDPDGENQISVAPGANDALDLGHVVAALGQLAPDLLLASLEIPERTARAAAEWCRDHGVPLLLNPAPMRPWASDLLPFAAYVTPNEHELSMLGSPQEGSVVIVTRGSAGAAILQGAAEALVPAPAVRAVDTTGAGDCFNGALAAGLIDGLQVHEAAERAVVAAALSVTKAGAREGMPTRTEIDAAMPEG
jgi:ribokinase